MDFKGLFNRRSSSNERRAKPRLPKDRVIKVLVVDDSRTVVHGLRSVLEQDGYYVMEAYDGMTAIELAKAHQPDIILMDVIMPGLNGFQATRKIRKDPATHSIPIIIISATEQPTEQFWLTKLGANDFLGKPIIRGDLFTKVETQLYPRQVVA
ncbi:MAG: response regulator [Thioalkalispiraceae bacterium]|jgi:twitching motility two-component system response regulator PilH